ncbi:SPX domain-containing protein 1 [Cajanus cajan]|uniref:Xenotropic and polytropic retrovirus receptor 1 n=1 Tax=Cajanus cajan TaxID=3821 RepID=A0A151S4S6_CAJCA|nr:SPX domain-containing protein 1 [Cajanus cajan]KYP49758.1 Xenotropic and polytropic retrovirus receptor 1 [Cajanus cajan]
MKFGKSLNKQMEKTLPQWRDKFLSYKQLKKKLKLVPKRPRLHVHTSNGETDFTNSLQHELHKFNTFFLEKEEECIIKFKELQDRVATVKDSNELMQIRKEIVDFHGEMVLLENYSALNYTGLVKILKKYDKRTGALIRLPFIQKVLQQPFFTTDLLYKLVEECEAMLDRLFPPAASGEATLRADDDLLIPKELAAIQHIESLYMKSTISALHSLQEIRKGSSTVSMFSLPPLKISGLEETWNKIPVLEQTAK